MQISIAYFVLALHKISGNGDVLTYLMQLLLCLLSKLENPLGKYFTFFISVNFGLNSMQKCNLRIIIAPIGSEFSGMVRLANAGYVNMTTVF